MRGLQGRQLLLKGRDRFRVIEIINQGPLTFHGEARFCHEVPLPVHGSKARPDGAAGAAQLSLRLCQAVLGPLQLILKGRLLGGGAPGRLGRREHGVIDSEEVS